MKLGSESLPFCILDLSHNNNNPKAPIQQKQQQQQQNRKILNYHLTEK